MRCDRVQEGKGYIAVTIVIAGLDGDREFERSAVFGSGVGDGWRTDREHAGDDSKADPPPVCRQRDPMQNFHSEGLLHLHRADPRCRKGNALPAATGYRIWRFCQSSNCPKSWSFSCWVIGGPPLAC